MPTTRSGRRTTPVRSLAPATGVTTETQTASTAEVPPPVPLEEEERNIAPLKPYGDDGTWREYLEYFNTVAKINRWRDHTKSQFLGISLTGHSDVVYKALPPAVKESYPALVRELSSLLASPDGSEARQEAFRNRKQHAGEPLAAFYSSLKCLGVAAYPSIPEDCLDGFIKERFVHGLVNDQLKFQVQVTVPKTSAQALSTALSLEPIIPQTPTTTPRLTEPSVGDQGSLLREVLSKLESVAVQLETNASRSTRRRDAQPGVCWNCGKTGHMRRQCTQSQPDKLLN